MQQTIGRQQILQILRDRRDMSETGGGNIEPTETESGARDAGGPSKSGSGRRPLRPRHRQQWPAPSTTSFNRHLELLILLAPMLNLARATPAFVPGEDELTYG